MKGSLWKKPGNSKCYRKKGVISGENNGQALALLVFKSTDNSIKPFGQGIECIRTVFDLGTARRHA